MFSADDIADLERGTADVAAYEDAKGKPSLGGLSNSHHDHMCEAPT